MTFDSVDGKHYDYVLCCSFRKSREIVWFSFLTTDVWSPKVSQLACPHVSVSVYLEKSGEKRVEGREWKEESGGKRGKRVERRMIRED